MIYWQEVELGAATVPVGQGVHPPNLETTEKVSAGQLTHEPTSCEGDTVSLIEILQYLPGWQDLHTLSPGLENSPSAQGKQTYPPRNFSRY